MNLAEARAKYGDFVDRFLPALMRADPLADAVARDFAAQGRARSRTMLDDALRRGIDAVPDAPESLRALFAQLDHVPVWVDWNAIDRAGDTLFRTGLAGGTVLGAKSLITGYCSPAGNKPLILSGQLHKRERLGYRLAETSRFVVDVCQHGGMRRFGPGFATTVRVRIMHATVRRLIEETGAYRNDAWGLPINQHDMAGTTLLFSHAFVQGVRAFGFDVTPAEANDYLHLWRYNGYLIGVEPELLVDAEAHAERMADVIALTQGEPDDDARMLVHALVKSPLYTAGDDPDATRMAQRQVSLGYGFTRTLLGNAMADKLDLPKDAARFVLPAVRRLLSRAERVGRRVPGYDARMVSAGRSYWKTAIEMGLEGKPANFMPPMRLDGIVDARHFVRQIVA